jgi:signal peptidase II
MKKIHLVVIIALVLIADQALKIYVKTTFPLDTKVPLLGNWSFLYFVENPGMAYGMKFGGTAGKLALTIFRFLAVIFGTWYLGSIIKRGYTKGFIICASLIYAGALGNLIDSCFYGIIFDKGMIYNQVLDRYVNYGGIATYSKNGYTSFLLGNVVDMLHFPIINGTFPNWLPKWGGESFQFFSPIFNIADASISTGVISLLVFQKSFFKQRKTPDEHPIIETTSQIDDASQMS